MSQPTLLTESPQAAASETQRHIAWRWAFFALWVAGTVVLAWRSLHPLLNYSLGNDDASHILLIPAISAWLLFLERKAVFGSPGTEFAVSVPLSILGALAVIWSFAAKPGFLSACAAGLVLLWIGGFGLAFGKGALEKGHFALLFLFLSVPFPESLLGKIVYFLQKGSAELSAVFFGLTPVPVLRDGFVFHLPHFSIEVARECSGIRSSIALLVLALLVGHFFFRSFWKQVVFLVAGLIVMIVKNAIRIVTLTMLANYVDPGFLYGNLHHEGGIVFFIIGLLLLVPVFWLLQRGEASRGPRSTEVPVQQNA
jgi:exosortase